MESKWIYRFDETDKLLAALEGGEDAKGLLGGKGANLAEMLRIGLPVPPGFTLTTQACRAYLEGGGQFPNGLWEQVTEALKALEKATGKGFGDARKPLLLSCRSGAKISMPGMMDTVLNIGLNDKTAQAMIDQQADARFVFDAYRRLIQMFGVVVMGIEDSLFEAELEHARRDQGVASDGDLPAEALKRLVDRFKAIFRGVTHREFPDAPLEQLRLATEAVFKSWNGKRAVDYRNAAGIPHDLGTAVNIQAMVFGNLGQDCATGVAMTRSGSTGERQIEGDYLINAQGEDVVAGIRQTRPIEALATEMPAVYQELEAIAQTLETHYREMQDIEFTVERGRLWMLQTRNGKRTAHAAVRIAVEMADEGLISREEAVQRVTPQQVDFFLHPQFDRQAMAAARAEGRLLGRGLDVSPGAAIGVVALDADRAEYWAREEERAVLLVRQETKPDDVHGMLQAKGVLTSRGGRTSHAALVARQFGKPAVVGVAELEIDLAKRRIQLGGHQVNEGEWLSIDGTTGEIYLGQLETTVPDIRDPWLMKLLGWADGYRRLGVWANADYAADAQRAREYGAQGIGLCRTEHMFFEAERLPHVQQMIMAKQATEQRDALDALLPYQREDFANLFRAMDGLPVIIRLIDPPLHEFLPDHADLRDELADLKIRLQHARKMSQIDALLENVQRTERVLARVEELREQNPMLGRRGVRLGIHIPELTIMQVRAIFEAACTVDAEGVTVIPKVMIPLTSHVNELKLQRKVLEEQAQAVMARFGSTIDYRFGTMIEIPRAAVTAAEIAEQADFFSFGTNDLTQTTYGISRDDAETSFLLEYIRLGILPENPFDTLDEAGVGQLMKMAVEAGRRTNPDLECGICGEHGGDPRSIDLCHRLGLSYVSCSPFRVPVARLAAAQAALRAEKG